MSKKVGLALGAGAARGFAHIGVIRALSENNIPIDMIAGCSMGALIGALHCVGTNFDMFKKLAESLAVQNLLELTVSRQGLVRGDKITSILKTITKDYNFEQTQIPLSVIAVELKNGDVEVFDSGPIYHAVRASISIPGVFVPYVYKNKTYVDGFVKDRTPVDTVRKMGADIVIACDVSYRGEDQPPTKNTIQTMAQVMNIMSWEITKTKIELADVLILPSVRKFNPYSMSETDECIAEGYKAATEKLDEILSRLKD